MWCDATVGIYNWGLRCGYVGLWQRVKLGIWVLGAEGLLLLGLLTFGP